MTIIKEHAGRRCIIRTNNYSHRLSKFLDLADEARRDFPGLGSDDIEVVHFGGRHYRNTWGIEFAAPDGSPIPDSYTAVRWLELTL